MLDGAIARPTPLRAADAPTLRFEDGQLDGYSGCNWFGGEYGVEGRLLQIEGGLSTARGCPDNKVERRFVDSLESVRTFDVRGGRLVLRGREGVRLVFDAQDVTAELVGEWQVSRLAASGQASVGLVPGPSPRLSFSRGWLMIDSGCNAGGTTWSLEGETIVIPEWVVTSMSCGTERDEQEQNLARALTTAERVTVLGDLLTLFREDGTIALEATRIG